MSKEVILKYLTEFNAWVKGQEVYVMFNNGGHQLVDSLEDFNKDVKYIVLRDSYFPYRTALAEGRTVEVYTTYGVKALDEQPWRRFAIGCSTFDLPVECYRIKPEEPKFKVGDFVRYIHTNSQKPLRIININCERYYFENAEIILRVDEIEKWEPKGGEVCIFWDTRGSHAIIDTFRFKTNNKYHTENTFWDNCMPFTGVLPPHMKENK